MQYHNIIVHLKDGNVLKGVTDLTTENFMRSINFRHRKELLSFETKDDKIIVVSIDNVSYIEFD